MNLHTLKARRLGVAARQPNIGMKPRFSSRESCPCYLTALLLPTHHLPAVTLIPGAPRGICIENTKKMGKKNKEPKVLINCICHTLLSSIVSILSSKVRQ